MRRANHQVRTELARIGFNKDGRSERMSDFQAIADRVEIETLRGEFTDAVMMRDGGHLAGSAPVPASPSAKNPDHPRHTPAS
jgi:hypothetical protein